MQHANVSNKHKAQNVSIAEADKITVKLIKDSWVEIQTLRPDLKKICGKSTRTYSAYIYFQRRDQIWKTTG